MSLGRLTGDKLLLYTQKTGVPVYVKLPGFVVEALHAVDRVSNQYFFGPAKAPKKPQPETGDAHCAQFSNRRTSSTAIRTASATLLWWSSFSQESQPELVSVLLGHSSIRVTEKHYAPWIRARQEQLEANLEHSWARDLIVLAETKGTPEVHGKRRLSIDTNYGSWVVSRAGIEPEALLSPL